MLLLLVWFCMIAPVLSKNIDIFEATDLSRIQKVNVIVQSFLPATIVWNSTDDEVFRIQVLDGLAYDKQNVSGLKLDSKLQSNTTHVRFEVAEAVTRDVAPATGRGNYVIFDAGSFFILLWLSVLSGNLRQILVISAVVIWTLVAHLIGQIFAQAGYGDKRKLLINISAPRHINYGSISLVSNGGIIRYNDITSGNNTECRTGLLTEEEAGCARCCNGMGLCVNNTCVYDKVNYDSIMYQPKRSLIYKHPLDPRLVYTKFSSGAMFYLYAVHSETGISKIKMDAKLMAEDGGILIDFDKNGNIRRINQNRKNQSNLFILVTKECQIRVYNKISRNKKHLLKTLNICNSSQITQSMKAFLPKDYIKYKDNLNKLRRLYYAIREPNVNNGSDMEKYIRINISVKSCGNERIDGMTAYIEPENDKEMSSQRINLPVFMSKGEGYSFIVPNISASFETEYETKCETVSNIVTHICSSSLIGNSEIICSDLNDLFSVPVNDTQSSCRNWFKSFEDYCDLFKTNNLKFQANYCSTTFDEDRDVFASDKLLLKPLVTFESGKVIKNVQNRISLQNISLRGARDMIITDDFPEFKIISIKLTPPDPLPLDLYQVRLDYACATNYTLIDMRVSGSDNYTNYATCSGTNQCNCCILHAAGAAGSVVDLVIINITDPWTGTNLSKTVVVVF